MFKYQSIRGTKDILPPFAKATGDEPAEASAKGGMANSEEFQRLEATARALFGRFGFYEIRTPTFETVELFQRSLGDTTDVVQKEMYVFEDRGGRKLALRPEGTAGVVRAFIEHHLSQSAPFCKLFYIGPMFRAERPQAGRYREFWQIGAEYFGNAAPAADAELLLMVQTLFQRLELPNVRLKVNSLGDAKCRPAYLEALRAYLDSKAPELCEDCQRRREKNPLRVLDCKTDGPKLTDVPTIERFWCDECRTHFNGVQLLLRRADVVYEFTPRLVRGLDYYTRTVFEATSNVLGAQDALAAGGRYDLLVKDLGGPDVPALGFAMGCERVIEAIRAGKVPGTYPSNLDAGKVPGTLKVFVAGLGENAAQAAFELLEKLRLSEELAARRVFVEGGFFEKKLGAQLTIANRLGATHALILGDDEIKQNRVTLKSLKTGTQETFEQTDLLSRLKTLVS